MLSKNFHGEVSIDVTEFKKKKKKGKKKKPY